MSGSRSADCRSSPEFPDREKARYYDRFCCPQFVRTCTEQKRKVDWKILPGRWSPDLNISVPFSRWINRRLAKPRVRSRQPTLKYSTIYVAFLRNCRNPESAVTPAAAFLSIRKA